MQDHLDPIDRVTEYRNYTSMGDKLVPQEIRSWSEGKPTTGIRLMHVTLYPKPSFPAILFNVPDGYQVWPGCDQYKAPEGRKDTMRQFVNDTGRGSFLGADRMPDGVRIMVGADGKAQEVQLINPGRIPPLRFQSAFMTQTYEPAICDGKPVAGLLFIDFVQ